MFYDLHLTDKEDPQINLGPHRSNLSESELYAAINSPGLIFVDDDRVSLVVRDIPDDLNPKEKSPTGVRNSLMSVPEDNMTTNPPPGRVFCELINFE